MPWLGRIPAHWEVRRNGRLFSQRNETGFAELPILDVIYNGKPSIISELNWTAPNRHRSELPPLAELNTVCLRHNAVLYVDDAHGTGVLGKHGRGGH